VSLDGLFQNRQASSGVAFLLVHDLLRRSGYGETVPSGAP
jgi:hypothetical protein